MQEHQRRRAARPAVSRSRPSAPGRSTLSLARRGATQQPSAPGPRHASMQAQRHDGPRTKAQLACGQRTSSASCPSAGSAGPQGSTASDTVTRDGTSPRRPSPSNRKDSRPGPPATPRGAEATAATVTPGAGRQQLAAESRGCPGNTGLGKQFSARPREVRAARLPGRAAWPASGRSTEPHSPKQVGPGHA